MTVNQLINLLQASVSVLSSGDVPVKIDGKPLDAEVYLAGNGGDYYVDLELLKQLSPSYLTELTWEDIGLIVKLHEEVITAAGGTPKDFCEETLRKFNEQRNK